MSSRRQRSIAQGGRYGQVSLYFLWYRRSSNIIISQQSEWKFPKNVSMIVKTLSYGSILYFSEWAASLSVVSSSESEPTSNKETNRLQTFLPLWGIVFNPRPLRPKGYCRHLRLSVCPSVCLPVPIILVNTITQSVYPISPPNLLGGCNMALSWMVL